MEIFGQVALVTGGASGLGRAVVDQLLARHAKVVVLDLPTSEGAALEAAHPGHVRFAPADVRRADEVNAALDAAGELGELRIVVNCAGLGDAIKVVGKDGPYPLEKFQHTIDVNLVGTFNVVRLAAARIQQLEPLAGEERGVIVNTASVAAFDGQIGQAAYAASKAAIVGMTLPIAREFAATQVRVMTIAPGTFDTPLLAGLPDVARESLGRQVPHPARLGKPSEFGQLVVQIIDNPMLNGESIRLDGAIRMAPR